VGATSTRWMRVRLGAKYRMSIPSRANARGARLVTFRQPLDAARPCACGRIDTARRDSAVAARVVLEEGERRKRLEHLLHEEVGQELAGIALILGAVRRSPGDRTAEREVQLRRIADLLTVAMGRCTRLTHGS
jgi:signal transduction histidine kinase